MQYSQFAMNIHSTNIARAGDSTYTRRDLITPSESGSAGPGVKRIRDMFIDEQYRNSSTNFGFFDAKRDVLGRVEDVFGDPVEGGLRQSIDNFFDKWQALAEAPADGVARLEVLSAGRQFVQQVKFAYSQIESVEQRANEMLVTRVNEVNSLLKTVYDLNGKLSIIGPNDPEAADMRDQRDAAIDQLAYLTGAQPQELPDGTVRVMVGSVPAVDGPSLIQLRVVGAPGANPTLEWEGDYHVAFGGSGVLGGLLSVRNGELDKLKTDLKSMAESVANAVNAKHVAGQGLDGSTGLNFFVTGPAPFDLANFDVNPALQPQQIAAGATNNPSDGAVARDIYHLVDAQILTSTIIPGQLQTARTFYRNMVGWVGSQAREVGNMADIAKTHQELNAQQRQSAWGVSLDEEVAFLTFQQKAFGAAARVFNVMDEMIDRLINGVGVR
jgi:flagellar hook-associated protein 1 FlgK